METWKDILGYEEFYQACTNGDIRSVPRTIVFMGAEKRLSSVVLKTRKSRTGYHQVILSKDGNKKMLYVHRIVAQTFIPNINSHPQINHLDENKGNNSVANLEWCTAKHNMNYGTTMQRVAQTQIITKSDKTVYQYDLSGNLLNKYSSYSRAARAIGGSAANISECCRKSKRPTAYGYVWTCAYN